MCPLLLFLRSISSAVNAAERERSDGTAAVANDRLVRSVDQRGGIHWRKSSVDQVELVGTKQRGPDGLDLDVRKRFTDAPVSPGAERNVAELLLAQSSLHVQESANVHDSVNKYIHT